MLKVIRVLHIVTKMDMGGLETMLMSYYRNIDRNCVQFDFLTHRMERGVYDDEIETLGGKIYRVHPSGIINLTVYLQELDIFFKNHPEYRIVHSHLDALSAFPLRAAKKNGVPVRIAHSHNTGFDHNWKFPLRIILRSLIPRYATAFWGCSLAAVNFMFGKKAACSNYCYIMKNAIDLDKFSFNQDIRNKLRRQLCFKSNQLVIGHVGRFSYQKNHKMLIDIFSKIQEKEPESCLILIGAGELEDYIRCHAKLLKLNDKIRFLGSRNDVHELMQAMDIFVMPSYFEGLGIVLIEAQAAGLPCFCSTGVLREVAITNSLRFLSLKDTPGHWAREILSARSNERELETLPQLRSAGYDIKIQSRKVDEIYLSM